MEYRRTIPNLPRILVVGRSGTGKADFAKKLAKLSNWTHVDMDDKYANRDINPVAIIPNENFCVVNWTLLPADLPFVAEAIFNKGYSTFKFSSAEDHIEKNLKRMGFDKKYIKDKVRIEEENWALEILNIFSNVSKLMTGDYFDIEGNYKSDEFITSLDFYFHSKLAKNELDTAYQTGYNDGIENVSEIYAGMSQGRAEITQ
jgi:hypothetical protein